LGVDVREGRADVLLERCGVWELLGVLAGGCSEAVCAGVAFGGCWKMLDERLVKTVSCYICVFLCRDDILFKIQYFIGLF
jgi:hypothetical protein